MTQENDSKSIHDTVDAISPSCDLGSLNDRTLASKVLCDMLRERAGSEPNLSCALSIFDRISFIGPCSLDLAITGKAVAEPAVLTKGLGEQYVHGVIGSIPALRMTETVSLSWSDAEMNETPKLNLLVKREELRVDISDRLVAVVELACDAMFTACSHRFQNRFIQDERSVRHWLDVLARAHSYDIMRDEEDPNLANVLEMGRLMGMSAVAPGYKVINLLVCCNGPESHCSSGQSSDERSFTVGMVAVCGKTLLHINPPWGPIGRSGRYLVAEQVEEDVSPLVRELAWADTHFTDETSPFDRAKDEPFLFTAKTILGLAQSLHSDEEDFDSRPRRAMHLCPRHETVAARE